MKYIKLITLAFCVCASGLTGADNGNEDSGDAFRDTQIYSPDTVVSIYLNYESFVNNKFTKDFPDITLDSLENTIRRTIEQWMSLSAVRLSLEYKGLTTVSRRDNAPWNSIVIIAQEKSKDLGFNSVQFSGGQARSLLSFYRYGVKKNGSAAARNWSAFSKGGADHYAIASVMMHEIGHAMGLHHNNNQNAKSGEIDTLATVMQDGSSGPIRDSFGPYREDSEDLRDLYSGVKKPLRLKVLRSTDGGKSWLARATNLNQYDIETHMPMSMVRDSDKMILAFTDVDSHPRYIMSDDTGRQWQNFTVFSRENSLYGTAVAGYDNEYMLAWVTNDATNKVRVHFSYDGGKGWSACSPTTSSFQSRASGTPAINKVSGSTWVLAYPKMESNHNGYHGSVVVRVSADDCKHWSDEIVVFSGEHALGGVSIASKSKDEIVLGFSNADHELGEVGNIVTLSLSIDAQDRIHNKSYRIESDSISTLSEPSLALSSELWFMTYRTPGGLIRTRTKKAFADSWSNMQKPIDQVGYTNLPLPMRPVAAAYRGNNSTIMFIVAAVPEDSPANGILD